MNGRKTKTEMLAGFNSDNIKSSRILKGNTIEINFHDGRRYIRYHETDIVKYTFHGEKRIMILNSGGWRTSTTKARMNEFQDVTTIYQDKKTWYVDVPIYMSGMLKDREIIPVPFQDGMAFSQYKGEGVLLSKYSAYSFCDFPVPGALGRWCMENHDGQWSMAYALGSCCYAQQPFRVRVAELLPTADDLAGAFYRITGRHARKQADLLIKQIYLLAMKPPGTRPKKLKHELFYD